MSILITGGTGFVGSGLARELVKRGEDVVLFDIVPRIERVADIKDKVKIVQGDLKVWGEVLNVVKQNNVEGIFHLGSMLSGPSDENPWAAYQTIFEGTRYVLEAARLFSVKRIVFTSSVATYGIGVPEVVTDETLQRPITIYGVGKLFGEHLGRFYRRKFNLDFRCLRYCGIVGPGASPTRVGEHLCLMPQNAALGKPYECQVSEDAQCALTYFKDAIRATIMLYDAPKEQIKTICYNVAGNPTGKSAKELAAAVRKFVPKAKIIFKPDLELMKFHREFIRFKVFDDSRAREEWGWKPLYGDLDKFVEDFIREVRTRPQLYGLA